MKIIETNIIQLFLQDTNICATQNLQLMKYQMEKHGWTQSEWEEYYQIYRDFINNFIIKSLADISSEKENGLKLTNQQVKALQNGLHDIINNIQVNIDILGNEKISDYFLEPIARCAADISDKVFIQTKDTVNEIKL